MQIDFTSEWYTWKVAMNDGTTHFMAMNSPEKPNPVNVYGHNWSTIEYVGKTDLVMVR